MGVMMPREKWTDERLDDRKQEVDSALTRIEMKLDEHSAGFARIDKDIRELRSEIRGMSWTLFAGFFTLFGTVIGTNVFF
jgi:hypothetical protein